MSVLLESRSTSYTELRSKSYLVAAGFSLRLHRRDALLLGISFNLKHFDASAVTPLKGEGNIRLEL